MVYKIGVKKRKRVSKKRPRSFTRSLANNRLVEQKRHRGTISLSLSTSASIVSMLSGNTQGLGDLNARIGDSLNICKIDFAYTVLLADTTNYVRIILFLYRDNNSTAPVEADVFDDSSSGTTRLYGPLNEDNIKSGRIKLLMDKRVTLYASKNLVGGYIRKTLRNLPKTVFSGGSTTVGRNMPYFAIISDSSAVTHPSIELYHTTHYVDL